MEINTLIQEARTVQGEALSPSHIRFTSVGEMLVQQAIAQADHLYLSFAEDGVIQQRYTYLQFKDAVASIAAALVEKGIRRGDAIATFGHNHPQTVIQYFAAWWIGAVVVPINPGEDDARIEFILKNSQSQLIFVREEYAERLEAILKNGEYSAEMIHCGGSRDQFQALLESDSPHVPHAADCLESPCLIVYTSGTTGVPKGVQLCQGNLFADAEGISQWHGINPATVMMCVLPIHHVNGTIVTLVTPMYAGASVVLCRKFQSQHFFPIIAQEKVAIVSVVPTLLAFLLEAGINHAEYDLQHFRHIICGAGPLTCELAGRFEARFGFPIIHGYGLSETTCYSCFLPTDLPANQHQQWMQKYGYPSIGVAIPQNEMAIHDEHGQPVPPGQRGEIVIRGHNVMLGYFQNDDANQKAFTFGWFRSGDEGFMVMDSTIDSDQRPYFFITGRLKELIIRGGVNISPLEIDEVINSHPKVAAGIAVGFENNMYGEEVGAYVKPCDDTLTEAELLEYCRLRLPAFKAPKVVIFGEDIPVTSTGKYQRNRVKHLFVDYKDHQFNERKSATNG
ncbi:MAG: acyl--CoA ligase [Chlorobi bacterium]|nr:acyl--CoA ligase [Chlorobiota bacterium]MBX7217639.1 acyl--CoA ligase [Candidatus Kapabacteria bacterium]